MARVEWAALHGDEVEAVLANLLYNWNGQAQRIRPTQGDFGIDVIVPASDDAEPWDVYQIKKYATNLTRGQKSKVVESFARMLIGLVRENLPIGDWYLVMPLDPTLDNLQDWFDGLPEAALEFARKLKKNPFSDDEESKAREWLETPGRKIEWKGLPFCETLAGDYPRVIDYYLHDGSERLREAVTTMTALIGGDMQAREASTAKAGDGPTALIEPAEVVGTLAALAQVLDTDPHYTYEHIVGPKRPVLQPEPNLVAAHQQGLPNGHYLTFKIYQRSAQSLEERPIPFRVEFKFEDGSPEHQAFEAWERYGKPFEAPAAFRVDLPGGLGGEGDKGWVSVLAPAGSSAYKLRMQVVDPEGNVLAGVPFEMRSTMATDGKGAWTSGHDPSNVLSQEGFYDVSFPEATQRINFSLAPLAGAVAAEVQPAVQFARHLKAPNRIQVSGPVGRFGDLMRVTGAEGLVPPAVERFVTALATIQRQTSHVIHVPDVTELTTSELRRIQRAADILEGGIRVANWDVVEIHGVPNGTLEQGAHYQLQVEVPLKATIDGLQLELGGVEQTLLSAVVDRVDGDRVRLLPNVNKTVHERFVELANPGDAPAGMTTVRGRPYPEVLADGQVESGTANADP
jgi:hypothetical protein